MTELAKGRMAKQSSASVALRVALVLCALVVVAGVALWAVQLSGGMVQTNMRNLDSWGLYITNFMFFVGLSAGGLIISSIPNALGMEGFGGIAKVAIWTSICCTIAAVGFVVVDLGGPARLWELFIRPQFASPLMWDIAAISTYLVLSIAYLVCYVRYEAGKLSHATIRVISVIALVCAVLVHSVTAWIFSLNAGREMWHTALMAPWFVSSALVCGTALVMVVVIALRKIGYLHLAQRQIVRMAKMLGAFCLVDLYFFCCDLLTEGFPGGDGASMVAMLVTGPLAAFFWIEILGCAVCAVVCLVSALRKNGLLVVGAVAAIAAIFCKRVQLLVGGFQLANITLPGALTSSTITFGMDNPFALHEAYSGMVYWPAPIEFSVALGVIALAVLLLLAGLHWLPLKPAE